MSIDRVFLVAAFVGLGAPLLAQAPTAFQQLPVATQDTIVRQITLDDLGYNRGITFTRYAGQEDLFFPAPDLEGLQAAKLILNYRSGATLDGTQSLQIRVDYRIVQAIKLSDMPPSGVIEVPIDPALSVGGFVRVTLTYLGGSSELVCMDERSSGDFLSFREDSGVMLDLDPSALNTVAAIENLQPNKARVSVPDGPLSPRVLTAALKAATQFGAESGQVVFGGTSANAGDAWTEAEIAIIDDAADPDFASFLQADQLRRWPLLEVSGADSQQAFDVFSTDAFSGLSAVTTLSSNGLIDVAEGDMVVGLDELGFDLIPQFSSGTATFDFPFDVAKLPQGTRADAVSLLVTAARGTEDDTGAVTAVAFLNDTILGSTVLAGSAPTRMTFDVPDGLVARDNLLRVQFLRQTRGGECLYSPQSFPAQVLPGSAINLVAQPNNITDFHGLRQDMQADVDVMVDTVLLQTAPDAFLNQVAPVLASVIPPSPDLNAVTSLSETSTTPFIYISDQPPLGADPKLRLDAGVVELRDAQDEIIFTGGELDQLAMAQIVTVGNRSDLWLRPGQSEAPTPTKARPLILDRGDVALMNENGLVLATSTSRSNLVSIAYPERLDPWTVLERYRPWIAVGIWIVLTLLVFRILRAIYVSRQARSSK